MSLLEKMKSKRVKVLSPDGFLINRNIEWYKNIHEAEVGFQQFKDNYEKQGYYSTAGRRIPLSSLKHCCQFINESETVDVNDLESAELIIQKLNDYSREISEYDYGLPPGDSDKAIMQEIIIKILNR